MFARPTAASHGTLPPVAALVTLAALLAAAGCASGSATSSAGGTTPAARASAARSPGAGTPAAPATTPGPSVPARADCPGWPANAPVETLPVSFVPVAVIRCQLRYQTVSGKGEWLVAALQRADQDLATLVAALRRPPGHMLPGMICPAFVVAPPQIVLVGRDGTMIRPRMPLDGCGTTQSRVLAALASLTWKTVSVTPISPVRTP